MNGELTHKAWLHFKSVLLQCPRYGFLDELLLQQFYQSHAIMNKQLFD